MKLLHMKVLWAGGFIALLLVGCKTTRICNSDGGMEVVQGEGSISCVSVDDDCFKEWLVVESSSLKRTDVGFLQSIVQIRNIKADSDDYGRRDDFQLQYQIKWFDVGGAEIMPDTAYWMRKTLHGGESVQFSAVAPDKSAVKFVFHARHIR